MNKKDILNCLNSPHSCDSKSIFLKRAGGTNSFIELPHNRSKKKKGTCTENTKKRKQNQENFQNLIISFKKSLEWF